MKDYKDIVYGPASFKKRKPTYTCTACGNATEKPFNVTIGTSQQRLYCGTCLVNVLAAEADTNSEAHTSIEQRISNLEKMLEELNLRITKLELEHTHF